MRVTVLGKSPSWEDAGGACSGYLVEEGDTALLVDCGHGAFAKLKARRAYASVDAVVLTHWHADHFLDLVPYSYALTHGPRAGGPPPVLHAPAGARAVFRRVVGAWGSEDLIESSFDLREYTPTDELTVGPLALRFAPVAHFVPTCAVEVRGAGGGRFVFGADTGPCDALAELASGADVLLAEATLVTPDEGHLTPSQAGEHAARAGVGRLVLTHITDELDDVAAVAEARRSFGGPVEVAREDAVYEI
jgi:ribonuclease BN (tRNA processing enzyme)